MSVDAENCCPPPLHVSLLVDWNLRPNHEEFSFQFARLAQALTDGGGSLPKCLPTLARITPGNGEDWYREWKNHAEACMTSAGAAFTSSDFNAAQNSWRHASAYYRSAGSFLAISDARIPDLITKIERCSQLYLETMRPAGEIVDISIDPSWSISGYFLRAPGVAGRGPAVICFGEADGSKDELLAKMPQFAFTRGLSLMIVDLPKQGALNRGNAAIRRNVEAAIGSCVDYLLARGDVDRDRIAIFGDGFGATYASRVAAFDHRVAAAVCDGGIWEECRSINALNWDARSGKESLDRTRAGKISRYNVARQIKCPFLVTAGECDFIDAQNAFDLHKYCKRLGVRMELKLFPPEEAGWVRRRFIFHWIAANMGSNAATDYQEDCTRDGR